jgi:hypothetical protein
VSNSVPFSGYPMAEFNCLLFGGSLLEGLVLTSLLGGSLPLSQHACRGSTQFATSQLAARASAH